jgi:hypothetical protein
VEHVQIRSDLDLESHAAASAGMRAAISKPWSCSAIWALLWASASIFPCISAMVESKACTRPCSEGLSGAAVGRGGSVGARDDHVGLRLGDLGERLLVGLVHLGQRVDFLRPLSWP